MAIFAIICNVINLIILKTDIDTKNCCSTFWSIVQRTTLPNLKAEHLLVFTGIYLLYQKKYGHF